MSMLGTGELCRAILDDVEVARAFDLDADSAQDFFSSLLLGSDAGQAGLARAALSRLDIVVGFDRPVVRRFAARTEAPRAAGPAPLDAEVAGA